MKFQGERKASVTQKKLKGKDITFSTFLIMNYTCILGLWGRHLLLEELMICKENLIIVFMFHLRLPTFLSNVTVN